MTTLELSPSILRQGDERRPFTALLGAEARRAVRHPAVVVGAAITALLTRLLVVTPDMTWAAFSGFTLLPLAAAALAAAQSAATRDRRDHTGELTAGLPAGRLSSVVPPLAVVLVCAAAATVVVVATALWTFGPGLQVTTDLGYTALKPAVAEIPQGVLVVAVLGLAGAALGRVIRSPAPAIVLAAVFCVVEVPLVSWSTASPLRYLAPSASAARTHWQEGHVSGPGPVLDDFQTAAAGWHIGYLLGLTALLTVVVVARRADRRTLAAGSVALAVTVVAGVLQTIAA